MSEIKSLLQVTDAILEDAIATYESIKGTSRLPQSLCQVLDKIPALRDGLEAIMSW
jgi:hypothetical protein